MSLPVRKPSLRYPLLRERDTALVIHLADLGYDHEVIARWIRGARRYLESEKIETLRSVIANAHHAPKSTRTVH